MQLFLSPWPLSLNAQACSRSGHLSTRQLCCTAAEPPVAQSQTIRQAPVFLGQRSGNAASHARALEAIERLYLTENGAPHRGTCAHALGAAAAKALDEARATVAHCLRAASPDEIVFTSSILAAWKILVNGLARAIDSRQNVIVSAGCSDTCRAAISSAGDFEVKVANLRLTESGIVDFIDVAKLLTSDTKLIVLQHVNGLTGAVHNWSKTVTYIRQAGSTARIALDASQSFGRIPVDARNLDVDYLIADGCLLGALARVAILYGRAESLAALPPSIGGDSVYMDVFLEEEQNVASQSDHKPRTSSRRFQRKSSSRAQTARRRKRPEIMQSEMRNWAPPPTRFEIGMPMLAGAACIAAILSGSADTMQTAAVKRHTEQCDRMSKQLIAELRSISDVVIIGSKGDDMAELPAAGERVVSFYMEGLPSRKLFDYLLRHGLVVEVGAHGFAAFLAHIAGVSECLRVVIANELVNETTMHSFVNVLRDAKDQLKSIS